MNLTSELLDQALPQAAAATGMVRIARGGQQRWIWPVHLPGWIALGWQVSHPGTSASAEGGFHAPEEQIPGDAPWAAAAPANSNAKRRGRKPKALETPSGEPEADPQESATSAEANAVEQAADADISPAGEDLPQDAASDAAAQPQMTSVLPDDLLSEAF
jgi:hypothetical protein